MNLLFFWVSTWFPKCANNNDKPTWSRATEGKTFKYILNT
jgi:hypothetical protein